MADFSRHAQIAESLFWIGRFIERSDDTARIVDVHLQLMHDDPWVDEDAACRELLAIVGSGRPTGRLLARTDVLRMLAVDRSQPASIAYSLGAARENARRARDIVTSELWECLNTTRARMPRRVADDKVHEFFYWVHERAALAVGIVESATSRDDTWYFFTLGRSIERAEMTARLLAARSLTEPSGPSWTTILRSCGAYEAYLRLHPGVPSAHNAAEFLLRDRLFPRSILFLLTRAEHCIRALEPQADQGDVTVTSAAITVAEGLLAQARSELENTSIVDILENIHSHMTSVQDATSAASTAISRGR